MTNNISDIPRYLKTFKFLDSQPLSTFQFPTNTNFNIDSNKFNSISSRQPEEFVTIFRLVSNLFTNQFANVDSMRACYVDASVLTVTAERGVTIPGLQTRNIKTIAVTSQEGVFLGVDKIMVCLKQLNPMKFNLNKMIVDITTVPGTPFVVCRKYM